MNLRSFVAVAVALAALPLAGCSAMPPAPAAAPHAMAAEPAAPAVLERSLYKKDHSGALSEDDMQTVLSTPIDLTFPARVGVVPLGAPFEADAKASLVVRTTAARDFSSALRGNTNFAQVSEVSTALPSVGGIEGLRTMAARYRVRYLVVYSEHIEDATHLNAWAWTYPTIVGMFVTPGVTVASRGLVEASMIDARTGTVLFSVSEPFAVSEHELMVGAKRSHAELQEEAAGNAARKLAWKVTAQTGALVAAADDAVKNEHRATTRIVPAPVASTL